MARLILSLRGAVPTSEGFKECDLTLSGKSSRYMITVDGVEEKDFIAAAKDLWVSVMTDAAVGRLKEVKPSEAPRQFWPTDNQPRS